jgi:hypothetical protein
MAMATTGWTVREWMAAKQAAVCSRCRMPKPISEFGLRGAGEHDSRCKECLSLGVTMAQFRKRLAKLNRAELERTHVLTVARLGLIEEFLAKGKRRP